MLSSGLLSKKIESGILSRSFSAFSNTLQTLEAEHNNGRLFLRIPNQRKTELNGRAVRTKLVIPDYSRIFNSLPQNLNSWNTFVNVWNCTLFNFYTDKNLQSMCQGWSVSELFLPKSSNDQYKKHELRKF